MIIIKNNNTDFDSPLPLSCRHPITPEVLNWKVLISTLRSKRNYYSPLLPHYSINYRRLLNILNCHERKRLARSVLRDKTAIRTTRRCVLAIVVFQHFVAVVEIWTIKHTWRCPCRKFNLIKAAPVFYGEGALSSGTRAKISRYRFRVYRNFSGLG